MGISPGDQCKFPRQIEGVSDAQVHSLSAGRRMNVSSISDEETGADPKGASNTAVDLVERSPFCRGDPRVHIEVIVEPALNEVHRYVSLPVRFQHSNKAVGNRAEQTKSSASQWKDTHKSPMSEI